MSTFFVIVATFGFALIESEQSVILVTLFVYSFGLMAVMLCVGGNRRYIRGYDAFFSVNLLAAGLAAVYRIYFEDPTQLYSDAGEFYRVSVEDSIGIEIKDLFSIYESGIAILIWREVYQAFATIGVAKLHAIGVVVNVMCVALAGCLLIASSDAMNSRAAKNPNLIEALFIGSASIWLFAALHLRDALILLNFCILLHVWIRFLLGGLSVITLVLTNLLQAFVLSNLRGELLYLPLAALAAYAGMRTVSTNYRLPRGRVVRGYLIVLSLVVAYTVLRTELWQDVETAATTYKDATIDQIGQGGSLAYNLIISQPYIIRVPLGLAYLAIFPIPIWSGFSTGSVYHLFKSLNVIHMCFLLPLCYVAVRLHALRAPNRRDEVVFCSLFALIIGVGVALTSFETRHFTLALPCMMLVASTVSLNIAPIRYAFRRVAISLGLAIILLHVVWIVLKA